MEVVIVSTDMTCVIAEKSLIVNDFASKRINHYLEFRKPSTDT